MDHVVALIGSLRRDSVNRSIFKHYQAQAKGHFELVEGEIHDLPFYNADISPEPPQVVRLAEKIKTSQGVLFFSPEYNYSIPGVLKNAIDWLSRNESQPFNGKAAAILGASPGNIGTARMQYHLRQVGVFLNLNFLNKPEVMIGQAMTKIQDGQLVDEATQGFLAKHLEAFVAFYKQHVKP